MARTPLVPSIAELYGQARRAIDSDSATGNGTGSSQGQQAGGETLVELPHLASSAGFWILCGAVSEYSERVLRESRVQRGECLVSDSLTHPYTTSLVNEKQQANTLLYILCSMFLFSFLIQYELFSFKVSLQHYHDNILLSSNFDKMSETATNHRIIPKLSNLSYITTSSSSHLPQMQLQFRK
ncbi:unnamed protein product [[Candida] boidinii]|nr:unnamed protein product [[Candida] boidinii]